MANEAGIVYLSGCVRDELLTTPRMGVIITPNMGNRPDLSHTRWAADNGCFSQGGTFLLWRYIRFLEDTMADYRATCLFATAPDVLGDAVATWHRSAPILPVLRSLGYPAALVAQDGMERLTVEWDTFDALFIGGSTRWKLSHHAEVLVREAKARGKHVHMGRVNSLRRLIAAAGMGCDSADGTYIGYGPDKNLPRVRQWLATLERQPMLWAS